jgi:hypothetical protein
MDRVTGFVDILGFADMVRRADNDSGYRTKIIDALARVNSVKSPLGGETDLRVQNFSDSLILSATDTPDGFWHLLLTLDVLAWNLLQIGVLVRGGVTIGGMYHKPEMVFGVAVNEAYRLESTIAKFPRIVLSARAFEASNEYTHTDEIWATYRQSRLLRDRDGVWFLNHLNDLSCFNRQEPVSPDALKHPLCIVGRNVRKIIQSKLDTTLDKPEIYAKIEWLARYWNTEVSPPMDDDCQRPIGTVSLAGMEPRAASLPFRTY